MATADRDVLESMRAATTLDEMRDALRRAQVRLARKARDADELVAAVYTAAKDAAFGFGPIPPPAAADRRKRGDEVALVHLTDWQFGKRTRDFNMAECGNRVRRVMARVGSITDLHRSAIPVRECHVMLGGDMVEGTTIFPGQAWEVEASLYDQLLGCAHLIAEAITAALATFTTVHVWPEYGNHGRIGRKGEQPSADNVDRMAYAMARQTLAGAEQAGRLVWHPEHSWYQLVEIGNYRALLVHGDEINSYGGNHPSYGIVKKVNGWSSGVVEPFHDAYMGHFHRPDSYTLANGGTVYITGSIESGNEYAREFMAATGHPQQRLHFIDPRKGRVTAEYRIRAKDD